MSYSEIFQDPRLDPRIKVMFGAMEIQPAKNFADRNEPSSARARIIA